ncbi:hypothetical protein K461DRAFT_27744 [Myriangium duriaei CBS 260.36]|uniref:Uncharacterized protein n=1 Tax=Myriangium duriaei CBS 260.36 TaxID=1168546 RepID=A0A9P4JAM1_9PEZI|nr:hypothetical protein K461DRAFT_27744 [Myriangium duriaei CBS 260.36]
MSGSGLCGRRERLVRGWLHRQPNGGHESGWRYPGLGTPRYHPTGFSPHAGEANQFTPPSPPEDRVSLAASCSHQPSDGSSSPFLSACMYPSIASNARLGRCSVSTYHSRCCPPFHGCLTKPTIVPRLSPALMPFSLRRSVRYLKPASLRPIPSPLGSRFASATHVTCCLPPTLCLVLVPLAVPT